MKNSFTTEDRDTEENHFDDFLSDSVSLW